ncbi:carbon-nitrogen hydrolase family protein [Rhizomonospora bruguierae]|uniref:carbon-nitrogen hydrolase family protein n=1 Tax=Rhizomonospora bruguierae TaxID=1581705 RepID=UPI001BD16CB4|nr:carbon-nitrogen hydrolase family protein [Micromonospora sp. NBRC 107566]
MATLTLAAVQAASVWLDRAATVDKACALIEEAGRAGADLVGFPENFIPGHPNWYYYHPATTPHSMRLATRLFKESVEVPGPEVAALARAAARASVHVVMGLTERAPGSTGTLYNTQLLIDSRGRVAGKHQKLLPTVGERLVHGCGGRETQVPFETELGPVSALACGENSNPLAVAAIAAAHPLVHVASWPNHFVPGGSGMPAASMLASRNVAYMTKSFVICSAGINDDAMIADCAATEADERFLRDSSGTGGTCIIDPQAQVIAGPMPGDREGILYAEVDTDACIRARMLHDVAGHYNRSDVYRLTVDNRPAPLIDRLTGPERPVDAGPVETPSAQEPRSGRPRVDGAAVLVRTSE